MMGLSEQRPAKPDVDHPPEVPEDIGADGFAVSERVGGRKKIFYDQRPGGEDKQKMSEELVHVQSANLNESPRLG